MPDGRGRGTPALAEAIIPLAAIVFTSYYVWSVRDGPWEAKFSAYFIGSALLVASAAFLAKCAWGFLRHRPHRDASSGPSIARTLIVKRLTLLALTIGYIVLIDGGGGFTLTNFAFLSCGILLLSGGARPGRAIGVAAGLALAGYLLFIVAFDTRFPEGPFEEVMESLLALE